MAKWSGKSKARKNNIVSLGREIVRRSKSTCELCGTKGVSLSVYEIGKTEAEPDFERCIHICDDCKKTIKKLEKADENSWRFLNTAIWSETDTVKASAIHLIGEIKGQYDWVDDLLEDAYIDEEIERIVNKMEH